MPLEELPACFPCGTGEMMETLELNLPGPDACL